MKPSIALGLKNLMSKIHPPLPLNPRESQRLLNLLTESFRTQLDIEHSKPTPVDAHIDSILSSPLLGPKKTRKQASSYARADVNVLEEVQSSLLLSTPADYFDNEVGSGRACLQSAKLCLRMEMQNLQPVKYATKAMAAALAESKASASVLHWLWSSGLEESMEFAHDAQFIDLLMPFMVLQGHQDRALKWIRRLDAPVRPSIISEDTIIAELKDVHANQSLKRTETFAGKPSGTHPLGMNIMHAASRPFRALLQATIEYQSLNAAMDIFLKVVKGYNSTTMPSSQTIKDALKVLARSLALQHPSPRTDLDIGLYDQVVAFCSDSYGLGYQAARLLQLHPTRPDATMALRYLRIKAKKVQALSAIQRKYFANHCLRTAKVLLATGKESDARWVMDFVQKNLAVEVGIDKPRRGKVREVGSSDGVHGFAVA